MNSCLYECNVMHCRVEPKKHQFNHKVFMFYLDLDELDVVVKKHWFISRNQWNLFSFYDEDHLNFGASDVRGNVEAYLKEKGLKTKVGKIMLMTNLRVLGYIFNPVAFYYCFDEHNQPLCVVPEISNTFRELKPFYLGPETFQNNQFVSQQKKYFYISPFIDLDVPMDFQMKVPNEQLDVRIDDLKDQKKFFYTSLTGKRAKLNDRALLWFGIKYPLITLKVISLIHIHAGILHYIKKMPYIKKESNPHLQKGVQREYVKK